MKKLGFTLAEVLITLVIIGVIAAMTIPTLMNNTNAQEYRSALKKAISAANQALTLQYALEGMTASDFSGAQQLVDGVFKKRMNVMDSTTSTVSQFTSTSNCSGSAVFVTTDGIIYCVDSGFSGLKGDDQDSDTTACNSYNTMPCEPTNKASLWIDVNGVKGPNTATTSAKRPKDIYQAQIYSQKVVPYGDATQQIMYDVGTESSTTVTKKG